MDREEILNEVNHIEIRTSERRGIKSYALRNNVLDEGQKESVLKYFPTHAVVFRDEFVKPETLFKEDKPVIVEIGFGMGSSTEIIARERTDYNYLCLEVYLQGFVRLLKSVGEQNLENIKLMRFNAVDVLEHMIPDGSVEGFHIFFPDPWPKKKHHSHRLFGPLFLNALWKRLEVGGKLEFATDHKEYFETVKECFAGDKRFEEVEPMPRPKEVWTEFETMFREQGLPIYSAAWKSLPADDAPLSPLTIPPEAEPREGIFRRCP